jgi:RimJ/RimL family protein N-acetyltransferase
MRREIEDKLTIRHASTLDSGGIAELFSRNYTKNYPYKELMHQDGVKKILETGEQVTLVAIRENQIIGCIALVESNNAHEVGRFIVDSPFRNLGVGKRLYSNLTKFIRKNKTSLKNVFTECVTSNGRSIAVAQKHGLKVIGFGIGIYENYFEENNPRETDCFLVSPIHDSYAHKTVYTHPNIKSISQAVYDHNLAKRTIMTEIIPPLENITIYDTEIAPHKQHAYLTIHRTGKDLEKTILFFLEKSHSTDALFLRIFLNMADVHTPYAIDILLNHNFFFCSLWPSFSQNDTRIDLLSLQYISKNNTHSLENLDIPTRFSKDLFNMLRPSIR